MSGHLQRGATIRRRSAALSAVLLLLSACIPAWSQAPQVPATATDAVSANTAAPAATEPPPPAAEQAAPPRENPGLINELGKLFKNPPALPSLKTPQQAIEDFNATMKGASSGLSLWGPSSMAAGRVKCAVADNGGADCKAAADTLCRSKSFQQGKSVDTEATQTCSAEALLLSGRKSKPGACRTDYFVTRAMCQ